jgi:NAD(P)-dependent dehydrogenase (short-subunit alcohol dehydrogenase family)
VRVLVTGASSGIGAATAQVLARAGHEVIAAVRRRGSAPTGVTELLMDARRPAASEPALRAHGPVDAVVSNAGITNFCALEDMTDDELDDVFATNLLGPLRLARLVLPAMRAAGNGRVVVVSSQSAYLPTPFVAAYSASKAGLEIAVESLAGEVRAFGVRCTLVLPGATRTAMATHAYRRIPADSPYASAASEADARGRAIIDGGVDPEVVAVAILDVLDDPDPPLRVVVGETTTRNIERFRPVDARFLRGGAPLRAQGPPE